jgi:carbamoyl-phosphate synthase large subunit
MVTADRRMPVIEVNPRFGGGAPLGIAAGADFPRWLLEETLGREPAIAFDGWQDGLMMLRYDWSVFVPSPALNAPNAVAALHPPPPFRS